MKLKLGDRIRHTTELGTPMIEYHIIYEGEILFFVKYSFRSFIQVKIRKKYT